MRVMKLAAGFAAGYVLGSRAGREKYEQIIAAVGRLRSHPVIAEAQQATKDLIGAGTDALAAKGSARDRAAEPTKPVVKAAPSVSAVPRPPRERTKSTLTAPSAEPAAPLTDLP